MSIRQFGAVAPCLALYAILNPTLGFTAISEAAESDSFAREPINDNRDPLIALVNERYFTPIQHIKTPSKIGGSRNPRPFIHIAK